MDFITKIKKNKRRFIGSPQANTKYQKRKEYTIFCFLFFQKKVKRIKKLNDFRYFHIKDFLQYEQEKKGLAKATLQEKEKILRAFYKRNHLDWQHQSNRRQK